MRCAIRVATVLGMTASLLAAVPASAAASTPVGSNLTADPNGSPFVGGFTIIQTLPAPGSALPVTAPTAGTIVAIRFKHGATASETSVSPRIVTATTPVVNAAVRRHERLPDVVLPGGTPAGIQTIVPVDGESKPRGVPIAAGEWLGLATLGPGSLALQNLTGGGGERVTLTGNGTGVLTSAGSTPDRELLLQFTLEPDADGDGYGDETQDGCPAQKGDCAPPEIRTIACRTGTRPAGDHCEKIVCKKGRKLRGNKCVKKRKHRRERRS